MPRQRSETAAKTHVEQHLRRLIAVFGASAVVLHLAAMVSVWDDRVWVVMIGAQTGLAIAFNAWASTRLLRRLGPERTEVVRLAFNLADVLLIGLQTDWGLAYWLWAPFFALTHEGLSTRHHRARFIAALGTMTIAALLSAADTLVLGVALEGIAALTYVVGIEHVRLAGGMLRELEDRVEQLRTAQAQLVRASHRAGMAEVATGVLHNVGNVLASINIATTTIERLACSDNIARLEKATALLRGQEDPARFLVEDPRGRPLLQYVDKIASALTRERENIEKEVGGLRRNVEHVKQIVRRQQSLARAPGVVEQLRIDDVIADAVALTAATKGDSPVDVELGTANELAADRHKLGEILTNLIANAREAVAGSADRRITVRTRDEDGEHVSIAVEDTGVGIAPESMGNIFTFGFTSKPKGHGFGLHASACAALELGGRLLVDSRGVGQGATFTLVLPRLAA